MRDRVSNQQQIEAAIRAHILKTYRASAICDAIGREDPAYPKAIKVSATNQSWTLQHTSELRDWDVATRAFAKEHDLEIREKTILIPTKFDIVTHIMIPSSKAAANAIESRWPQDAHRGKKLANKLMAIRDEFGSDALTRVCDLGIHRIENESDTDFDLLLNAARYMSCHDVNGLTPRQVPLPGFSAKWLNMTRLSVICAIIGNNVTLIKRPTQIDFAYLDPDHAAAHKRHFDSYVIGDEPSLAYIPETIIIVENVDNMRAFPQTVKHGICVFGHGYTAVATLSSVDWIRDCDNVLYWGDMDKDGYAILDSLRATGIDAKSINMGSSTYRTYAKYGTSLDKSSRQMVRTPKKDAENIVNQMQNLTEDEKEALSLCLHKGSARRIEQERIPFPEEI